jgi:mono/diheme cytochrome c family protein
MTQPAQRKVADRRRFVLNAQPSGRVGGARLTGLAAWLIAAVAVAPMSGCAYSALEGPYGTEPAAVARGKALAETDCGSCHGLGASGESRFPGAPPFRDLRFDYNAISYARATSQWHVGLAGMPSAEVSLDDVAYIGAYIRSLKQHQPAR